MRGIRPAPGSSDLQSNIRPDQVWVSDLNRRAEVRSGLERDKPVRFYDTT